MKLKAAECVECRFLMSRSLEAYLLADKKNRAMLAAAIYVFLRTTVYRRVLMRMRGICSIYRSILFRTRNLPTTEHTFFGVWSSVCAIPRKVLYWQSLFHHKRSLTVPRHSQGMMTAVETNPSAGPDNSPARQTAASRDTQDAATNSTRQRLRSRRAWSPHLSFAVSDLFCRLRLSMYRNNSIHFPRIPHDANIASALSQRSLCRLVKRPRPSKHPRGWALSVLSALFDRMKTAVSVIRLPPRWHTQILSCRPR